MFMGNGGYGGAFGSFGGAGYGSGGVSVPTITAPIMPNIAMPKAYTPMPLPAPAPAKTNAAQQMPYGYSNAGTYFGHVGSNGLYSGWSPR